MKKLFLYLLCISISISSFSQTTGDSLFSEKNIVLKTATGNISGSLTVPKVQKETKIPVVIIIAGSGPTDRNGNNTMMTNNSLKMLAYGLSRNGIAVLRYDKRGVAESKEAYLKEENLRLEKYIDDVNEWIYLLKKDKKYSQIILIGHSLGSLIGLVAAQKSPLDKFISIAGSGRSFDKLLKEQLAKQPDFIKNEAYQIIDSLVQGDTVSNVSPMLLSLFRPSIQKYWMSILKYDPKEEIEKLKIPCLIMQGTTDIQITVEDAKILHSGNENSELNILEEMNHVLKVAPVDKMKNVATYNQPDLPLHGELIKLIIDFIKNK